MENAHTKQNQNIPAFKIPAVGQKLSREVGDRPFTYEPAEGELILVTLWCVYPSYDFIFGVPHESNPKKEKECAFFAYRDSRTGNKYGFYYDATELDELIQGFQSIREKNKK